jgi:hypothetical protein
LTPEQPEAETLGGAQYAQGVVRASLRAVPSFVVTHRLLDQLRLHLVPLLLGAGTPLFDGEQAELISEGKPVTGTVTHLHYRVQR